MNSYMIVGLIIFYFVGWFWYLTGIFYINSSEKNLRKIGFSLFYWPLDLLFAAFIFSAKWLAYKLQGKR